MKCCIQNCHNHIARYKNRKKGISFHKFPKHPDHLAAWLKVLSQPGYQINSRSVVCSEHFKPDCFEFKRRMNRIKSGAIPTILPTVNPPEFKVCRVCLAVDVNMYDMKEFKLAQMFHNVTGILACSKEDSTLHRICWECAARLAAAAAFRDKALFSDVLLKDLTNIQLSDITSIRETYSSLKSPLTIQTVFTSTDIQCSDSVSVKSEEETLVNDDSDLIASDTETRNTEEDFDGPWIEAPVKTEAETNPIAENNTADTNERTHSESIKEEDNITGTVTREAEVYEGPKINDTDVVLEDHEEEKSELDESDDVMEEGDTSSSGEDTADELSVDGDENNMSSEVAAARNGKKYWHANRNNDFKEEIIDLKRRGFPTSRVARLLKTTIQERHTGDGPTRGSCYSEDEKKRNTVKRWWERWNKEGHMNHKPRPPRRKKTTPLEDQLLVDRVSHEQIVHTPSLAKEFGISTKSVIRRLNEAGWTALRPKAQVPLRSGRSHVVDDDTKQQIVLLKLNGVSVTDIANQFRVTRSSIYRWSREVKINEINDNITNTTTEDQSVSGDSEARKSAQVTTI